MKKITSTFLAALFMGAVVNAQTNFSGDWIDPALEMIDGKQYSNAMPKQISVSQTKDSIKIVTIEVGDDAAPVTRTFALNGKTASRMGKTSKRTIKTTASWNNEKNKLTITTIYSYAEKPDEAEYKNTETWEISDGKLSIIKNSDATVTDDWTIKAVYNKQ